MPLGRWRKHRYRREEFAKKALARTRKTQTEIAKRSGLGYLSIEGINALYGIRTRQETLEILANASRENTKKRLLKKNRKPLNHFSTRQKQKLLNEWKGLIIKRAITYWNNPLIRKLFGNFDTFIEDIKGHLFNALDYYDSIPSAERATAAVSTFMLTGMRFFYLESSREANRLFQGEIAIRSHPLNEQPKRLSKNALLQAVSVMPNTAKKLFTAIGILPSNAVQIGYPDLIERISKIANQPETGLTDMEKQIINAGLRGMSLGEVGKKIKDANLRKAISHERARQLENAAIAKIKAQIGMIRKNN